MKKFKKIFVSFSLGLLLSVVPITAFAVSGENMKTVFAKSTITIKRIFVGGCPPTFDLVVEETEQYKLIYTCTLNGESPDDGSGVSVCSYQCSQILSQ